jgi:hypothetical protein
MQSKEGAEKDGCVGQHSFSVTGRGPREKFERRRAATRYLHRLSFLIRTKLRTKCPLPSLLVVLLAW